MAKTTLTAEPGQLDVTIVTTFNAPLKKVWEAYTDPKLLPEWWGPAKYTTDVAEMDVRDGGKWHFIQVDGDDKHSFHGVYHDVTPLERIVQTFEYDELGEKGHVCLDRTTYREKDGVTTVTTINTFLTQEDRDGMINTGMEGGMREGIDRLAKLIGEKE